MQAPGHQTVTISFGQSQKGYLNIHTSVDIRQDGAFIGHIISPPHTPTKVWRVWSVPVSPSWLAHMVDRGYPTLKEAKQAVRDAASAHQA